MSGFAEEKTIDKVIVITGASGGIGAAAAREGAAQMISEHYAKIGEDPAKAG